MLLLGRANPAAIAATRPAPAGVADAARYKGWVVSDLVIKGLPTPLADKLKSGLQMAGSSGALGRKRSLLFARTLQDDLDRTVLFLRRHGYPRAVVSVQLSPKPGKRQVEVVLLVNPGKPVRLGDVSSSGLPPGLKGFSSIGEGLARGSVLEDPRINAAGRRLEELLRDAGYAFARVEVKLAIRDSFTADVILVAEPGTRRFISGVQVSGADPDLAPLVRRTVDAQCGTPFDPGLLTHAQEELRTLGLFRRIQTGLVDTAQDSVDVRVDVAQGKFRETDLGFGFWTEDEWKVSARWRHLNFFRKGRGLESRLSASRYRQEADLVTWWPLLLGSGNRTTARLNTTREDEASYRTITSKVELGIRQQWDRRTAVVGGLALSNVQVDIKTPETMDFGEDGGLLTIFFLQGSFDSSDDRLYPSSGMLIQASTEYSPAGFLSQSPFVSFEASASFYQGILSGLVLATRMDLGVAWPLGDSHDLLPNKRFFAGGATSMRGARRRELGPTDAFGDPIGGRMKALAGAEIRFPLYRGLRGAMFLDGGQVWRDSGLASPGSLAWALGPGLMFRTPVGPLRADFAYNLQAPPAGEPRTLLQISIGNPF